MSDDDANTFEALDDDDEELVGPPGALLYGFAGEEAPRVAALLEHAGTSEHQVVGVTTTMGEWTVARALEGSDEGKLLPVDEVPRIVLLSGLTGRQVNVVLDAYRSTDLPRPIFAVATPTNLAFTVVALLGDLLEEMRAATQ